MVADPVQHPREVALFREAQVRHLQETGFHRRRTAVIMHRGQAGQAAPPTETTAQVIARGQVIAQALVAVPDMGVARDTAGHIIARIIAIIIFTGHF